MRIWGITDTGLVRKENQDAYATAVVADCTVAVVCDGMGGTNGGHTASVIAVETLQQLLQFLLALRHSHQIGGTADTEGCMLRHRLLCQ